MARRTTKTVALSICVVALSVCGDAFGLSEQSSSPNARKLASALCELRQRPTDVNAQNRYLAAFPKTYSSFLQLFDLGHELYDGYDYVAALTEISKTNPVAVGHILVYLSKDAQKEADAPTYLQNAMVNFAAQNTQVFVTLTKTLPRQEQDRLIRFLADIENFGAYPEYQTIIDNARRSGDVPFARRLENARISRSSRPHD